MVAGGQVETPGTEAIRGPMRYILDIQLTATSPHDNSTVFPGCPPPNESICLR